MTRGGARDLATVADVLLDAHRRATAAGFGEGAALYLVRLTEPAGLALAVAVHAAAGGADPLRLRERAQHEGVSNPVMAAAVAMEALAVAVEGLAEVDEADRRLLGWAVRELRRSGEVPVLLMLGETVFVTSLSRLTARGHDTEAFAWSLPAVGDA